MHHVSYHPKRARWHGTITGGRAYESGFQVIKGIDSRTVRPTDLHSHGAIDAITADSIYELASACMAWGIVSWRRQT